jgi:hypothetical protein
MPARAPSHERARAQQRGREAPRVPAAAPRRARRGRSPAGALENSSSSPAARPSSPSCSPDTLIACASAPPPGEARPPRNAPAAPGARPPLGRLVKEAVPASAAEALGVMSRLRDWAPSAPLITSFWGEGREVRGGARPRALVRGPKPGRGSSTGGNAAKVLPQTICLPPRYSAAAPAPRSAAAPPLTTPSDSTCQPGCPGAPHAARPSFASSTATERFWGLRGMTRRTRRAPPPPPASAAVSRPAGRSNATSACLLW